MDGDTVRAQSAYNTSRTFEWGFPSMPWARGRGGGAVWARGGGWGPWGGGGFLGPLAPFFFVGWHIDFNPVTAEHQHRRELSDTHAYPREGYDLMSRPFDQHTAQALSRAGIHRCGGRK